MPLFDFGEVRVRQAEQTYLQAVNRLTERAVNVRSEARDAYRNYRSTYDIAMHYQREVLPLRKIISDETLLRYNAMQIDVFALLAEARLRTAANGRRDRGAARLLARRRRSLDRGGRRRNVGIQSRRITRRWRGRRGLRTE